ncbi:NADP-dependent oxidoreductase [Pseudohalioglobus lutimaris]|uniref:NADP-dependent oxidoreductase n=1 Tax=Pseudohalioglobus lutimaris TaxID=1737061 RepID=A0A2N5X4K5_9GAMM|nr:NADP-dependent oxidoreductase [Pseudohalioglobus lutimaris]PLW69415.1 NADP-dependent oxidoreductase [Pseudohalioglobus lutimaris]
MTQLNKQWLLKQRPVGMVSPDNFELVQSPMPSPDLDAGQVLIKTLMLGFDPAMRGWLEDVRSYLPPVAIGEPMRASGVGQVIASRNAALPEGALVQGLLNWQAYSIGDPAGMIPPRILPEGVTPGIALSVFGTTSLTAYFGLLDVGQPKSGDTVLVSGAAGATGSVVAQIARLKGCRVIGIAGGAEKCAWLTDTCKLDGVIDYKSENIDARLTELCPDDVDVFFDNVGGDTLEAGISHMADFGRIVLCGAISQYNEETPQPGPNNLMILVARRIRMQGFIVIDYLDRAEEAFADLANWVMGGDIAWREDIQEGFENIPATLQRLFDGRNQGKQMLKLADPQ